MASFTSIENQELIFRLKGGFYLSGLLRKLDESSIKAAISEAINEAVFKVNSEAFVVNSEKSSLVVWPKTHISTHLVDLPEDAACKSILKFVTIEQDERIKKINKKKAKKIIPVKVINFNILFEMTRPETVESMHVLQDNKSRLHFSMILPVDALIHVKPDDTWGKVQDLFVQAVTTQLGDMEKVVQQFTKGQSVPIPQPFHFSLRGETTFATVVYPAGISDGDLESYRKTLHRELDLPDDRPFLRRVMAYRFPHETSKDVYLPKMHQFLIHPATEDAKVYLVQGSYNFYHYLQDNIEDADWGCAYRSLQTIVSWYRAQGYTTKPVPTHEEIQEALVAAGDKTSDIIGSSEWIGCFEIQQVLDSLGFTAKIINVRTGAEFPSIGRELANHFTVEGSPITVAGDRLANTILGVIWNENTGDLKFLVMDPHYMGDDEWNAAIERGIDWKGIDFWNPMESFNLCLPQRPSGV
ncbi:ufm1-specific protease 2 [Callorhinchus milii]|uniref:Ufm1-specific protease 2 n=1 Tax=Callorhinchus milii TaxID=7868 RepID=A0A4W3IZE6_CALMI|nr:ufm1-specific protease 2 [Callorhinchus milii]|eukprot:gi/632950952/ref/XP_007891018.1/ PREDICTED: ufm1-specific protease 2 [Callorhinchus milii]